MRKVYKTDRIVSSTFFPQTLEGVSPGNFHRARGLVRGWAAPSRPKKAKGTHPEENKGKRDKKILTLIPIPLRIK
jgi:hypothetical protein